VVTTKYGTVAAWTAHILGLLLNYNFKGVGVYSDPSTVVTWTGANRTPHTVFMKPEQDALNGNTFSPYYADCNKNGHTYTAPIKNIYTLLSATMQTALASSFSPIPDFLDIMSS
jgi:hypothetical protein